LLHALARVEADIDFPDEDLPEELANQVRPPVVKLLGDIKFHLDDGHRGERLREGFSIVILGPPNVGKSSLLNALSRRDAAIVSSIAGTTRDVIEVLFDLNGFPVVMADTAGLRESDDPVEQEGMRRALSRAENADLKLVLVEACRWPELDSTAESVIDGKTFVVLTKIDLCRAVKPAALPGPRAFEVSAATGEGMGELMSALGAAARSKLEIGTAPAITRLRHRRALEECASHLDRFLNAGAAELAAEDLRLAARALGRITGHVDVEDILDIVFREFCIGK